MRAGVIEPWEEKFKGFTVCQETCTGVGGGGAFALKDNGTGSQPSPQTHHHPAKSAPLLRKYCSCNGHEHSCVICVAMEPNSPLSPNKKLSNDNANKVDGLT